MKKPKIKLVDWGIANNFGKYIEIHKDLPKYPELYNKILEHELQHGTETFTWKEFVLDLKGVKGLIPFMIHRPKTWIQVLPIYYQRGKGWVFDLNLFIISLITISLIVLDFILLVKFIRLI